MMLRFSDTGCLEGKKKCRQTLSLPVCLRKLLAGLLFSVVCAFFGCSYFLGLDVFSLIQYPCPKYPPFPVEKASTFQQTRFNCSAILAGDKEETERAVTIANLLAVREDKTDPWSLKQLESKKQTVVNNLTIEVNKWSSEFKSLTNQWYLNATKDCAWFKQTRGYITSPLTQEEEEFPIAFSLLVYKDLEQMERLFRMVYRPQNRYCIHVDSKSSWDFYSAVASVAACFPGSVRMSSRRVDVQWGKISVLEPELVCMRDLWDMDKDAPPVDAAAGRGGVVHTAGNSQQRVRVGQRRRKKEWKYFINLTGQEFPLKTNFELVRILKAFKGANNQEGTRKRALKNWWRSPLPYGLTPTKGAVHTCLNRATIDFILHNPMVNDFLQWLETANVPDETFFSTINYNPQLGIPGTYNGNSTNLEIRNTYTRFKLWRWNGIKCATNHYIRDICILTTGDIPLMSSVPYMFANKFYLKQDRVVIGCLEEMIFNRTRDQSLGIQTFDSSFYEGQDFVKSQVPAR